ncbi:filamentous hemagglutinin N-terminal domain-containing protein, partial [bacterium]|nr:filamentous hemagglutinin N-terminal domain-containing protein [bacterium]
MARNRFLTAYLLGASFLPSALLANDLPTDPTVVSGDVAISNPSASQMVVSQSSGFGVVDWGSFSIGQGFGVQFNNGTGATLNRVTGTALSSIMGNLNATGSVFLINPNGIIVGKTGVVNTGGRFVASTLDTSDADFLDGGDTTFAGTSDAYVVNLGKVSSMGGDVALLARNVVNEGTVTAPNGTVGLVAGREILMRDAAVDDGLFAVKVGGSDTAVNEAGAIKSAAAELRAKGGNVYALAGNTSGTIEATGVAKVAGRVFLTADGGALKVDKTVKARAADGSGGKIVAHAQTIDLGGQLVASGSKGGTVEVKGSSSTSFTGEVFAQGAGGPDDGGFVEISGGHLSFEGAVQTGGGTLLIDPDNLEITSFNAALQLSDASAIYASTIESNLAGNNVVVATNSANAFAGTIVVNSAVTWNSKFSLTLLAQGDILFNSSVQNDGTTGGAVNVVAGWDGVTGVDPVTGIASFDPAVYDSANLATQTLFGLSNNVAYTLAGANRLSWGTVYIGQANNFNAVAVGARSGATRVYADNLFVLGSRTDATYAYAQLGFNVTGGGDAGTISGNISVRATGSVLVVGGLLSDDAAQIGHVGVNSGALALAATVPSTVAVTGDISVEALGDVVMTSDVGAGTTENYAMIGNGALTSVYQTGGDRIGNITVTAGGVVTLDPGAPDVVDGLWIGALSPAGSIKGNVTLTAARFDQPSVSGAGGASTLYITMPSQNIHYGDVRITATASPLTLTGSDLPPLCDCGSTAAPGNFIVQTSGDLALGGSFFYSNVESSPGASDAGGGLVLASGGNVTNVAGAFAIGAMTGPWLIYSDRPDHDSGTLGVLIPEGLAFGKTYDPADPLYPSVIKTSGLVYAKAPLITVSDAAITYGMAALAASVVMTVNGTSEVISDPSTWGFTLSTPVLDTSGLTYSSPDLFINAGTYTGAYKTVVSTSVATFGTGYFLSYGTLLVNPATITVTLADQTKTYDAAGYGGSVTYTGFQGSDTAALISSGPSFSYTGGDASGVNAGTYTVSASGATETSGNYVFDQTDTAQLVINPATITVSLADQTKTYDAIGGYTGAVTYTGFQGSDTAALISSGPSFSYTGGDASGVNAGTYTVSA